MQDDLLQFRCTAERWKGVNKVAVSAYVLIRVEAGKIRQVAESISQIDGVKEARACWGQLDIFAYVEVPDQRALSKLVLTKIQGVDGVVSSDTHIVVEF